MIKKRSYFNRHAFYNCNFYHEIIRKNTYLCLICEYIPNKGEGEL